MSSDGSSCFFSHPQKYYEFPVKGQNRNCVIKLATKAKKIAPQAPVVLSNGFIDEYLVQQRLSPNQLGSDLQTKEDVERFYKNYFEEEKEKFSDGVIHFWVEAFVDNELVGWATFRREGSDSNAVYMELLVVSPEYKGKGIGSQLVFSLIHLNEIPDLHAINLELRILNAGGRVFYEKLEFYKNPGYVSGPNAVESHLLEVYTWHKPRPVLQEVAASEESSVSRLASGFG